MGPRASLGCRVRFTASGAQTATGCMSYDAATQYFHYNWKLGSATELAYVTVAVSYPGSMSTTSCSVPITITTR